MARNPFDIECYLEKTNSSLFEVNLEEKKLFIYFFSPRNQLIYYERTVCNLSTFDISRPSVTDNKGEHQSEPVCKYFSQDLELTTQYTNNLVPSDVIFFTTLASLFGLFLIKVLMFKKKIKIK